MKLVAVNLLALMAVVALAVGIGYTPTQARWGAVGVGSMWAAAGICLAAAFVAAVPLVVAARRWPTYVGQAALGGTVIRLLVTGALTVGYQVSRPVHLQSLLVWLVVLYLLLLAVETTLGIVVVRKYWQAPAGGR